MAKKVVVGLSGGVDSAVSAYLLQKQGYSVIGLFMKNWEDDGVCPSSKDYQDVIAICNKLQIPYYTINFTKDYEERVFQPFLQQCKEGKTPNPDILCNSKIKFDLFLEKGLELADLVATGHYCRVKDGHLYKGKDPNKDQSYFLYAINKKALQHVLFPLGELSKEKVRQIAYQADLPVYQKKDSTGICFIGKRNFKEFVSSYLGFTKGPMKDLSTGKNLGHHDGLAYYTIGQRKGLAIGGEGAAWYVAQKDKEKNILWVVQGEDDSALYATTLYISHLHLLIDEISFPFSCSAKIRYRMPDSPCTITLSEKGYEVAFDTPQRAITEGQSIVFYKDDLCIGGGIIEDHLTSKASTTSSFA